LVIIHTYHFTVFPNIKFCNNRRGLEKKLDEVIKTYNETRPHQSLKKMSPLQYENYLTEIEKENRKKMTIYTVNLNEDQSLTKQLNLFNPL
jgi:hypothetical protein